MIKEIKRIRVQLDKNFNVMKVMTCAKPSREISIAITSAQNAKMWLGQVLKELKEENPYPESKNASNSKIEPTADAWDGDIQKELSGIAHIQKVKQLRSELSSLADDVENNKIGVDVNSLKLIHCLIKSFDYITESNMWLGMELGRINSEKK